MQKTSRFRVQDLPPLPSPPPLKHPKLESGLNDIVSGLGTSRLGPRAAGADTGVAERSEESVSTTIHFDEGYADAVSEFVTDNGGSVQWRGERYIAAHIPVGLLVSVSRLEGVGKIRELPAPILPQEVSERGDSAASEAHSWNGVSAWHSAGYRGQGVKIGVIDAGFEGFVWLMGSDLPSSVRWYCGGGGSGSLWDCGWWSTHGTKVTQALFDVAPEAEYYITTHSLHTLENAIDWMVSQGVDIINMSMAWQWNGPGDGTSPYWHPLRIMEEAVDKGMLVVNSAGNFGQTTWFGEFSDPDGDGWHNFEGSDECSDVELRDGEGFFAVDLRWDDVWGGADRDLDLYIIRPRDDGSFSEDDIVDIRNSPQSGEEYHEPKETFSKSIRTTGTGLQRIEPGIYCIAVKRESGAAPGWVRVQSENGHIFQYVNGSASVLSPAHSAKSGLLAVGAASLHSPEVIEGYSSRGPTTDGRIKPDITGLTCHSAAGGSVCGTSGSAPYVSGLAALVKQRFPHYTPEQIAEYLKDNAKPRGVVPNNTWGYGLAALPLGDIPPAEPVPTPTADPARPGIPVGRLPEEEFDTLGAAGNNAMTGMWSDGTVMWVADWEDDKIYAYDHRTKRHEPSKDIYLHDDNTDAAGIWSDGTTMWVSDWGDDKLYAYDMSTKQHDASRDKTLHGDNADSRGIWSDGTVMWVADWKDPNIFAYSLDTMRRVPSREFDHLVKDSLPRVELYSDGSVMWVVGENRRNIFAYELHGKNGIVSEKSFKLISLTGNEDPYGLWSNGSVMWVGDRSDDKIYAYGAFPSAPTPAFTPTPTPLPPRAHGYRLPDEDFNALSSAGNNNLAGMWANGATLWVADGKDDKLYAYDVASKQRDSSKDIILHSDNANPRGVWSNGATLWIADRKDDKIYAYDMSTKQRDSSQDFNTLKAAGNRDADGLWSNGATMWVADRKDGKLYAYDMSTKRAVSDRDIELVGNILPGGLYSRGRTIWVVDENSDSIYAYGLDSKDREPEKDFDRLSGAGNNDPYGLWSNGSVMWVNDWIDDKIYAYAALSPSLTPTSETPRSLPPAPAVTPTPTVAATPTVTPSPTPTAAALPIVILSPAPTAAPEATVVPTPAAAATPIVTPSPMPTPEAAPTPPVTPISTFTPIPTIAATPTATPTAAPEATPTATTTPEDTHSPTPTPTPTATPASTFTPTSTPTPRPTVTPTPTQGRGARLPDLDFNSLAAAGNNELTGIWASGNTLWVADWKDDKMYAYDINSKERDADKDIPLHEDNANPRGVWANGSTLWVADRKDDKIYAYDMSTKQRDSSQDFNTLKAAGNKDADGLWSNGAVMWVADRKDNKLYAYDMATKQAVSSRDIELVGNIRTGGLYSNGVTIWVVDENSDSVHAYDLRTNTRESGKDFKTLSAAGNNDPYGLWSNGSVMWVNDWIDDKIYAYDVLE